ncbi:autotransporter domain-containing protein [Martelella radicis]|uniref:Outer membrane autotransporter protein n=1 Tax=Martelella radicis TaxID=1397476 RepID=A0A7W6KGD4_9HYPH|nr:autotransporter domain-containing protein [Martelella radicis]MBB4120749.1 outer membrane autotransporter protein [Martelella radicis]
MLASTAFLALSGPALAGLWIDTDVTVDGIDGGPYGTAISEPDFVSVGVKDPASLTISRGGTVTAPIANIGTNEYGMATITGAGSLWHDFVISRVGWNAEGVVTITDSGAMSGKDMVLGANDIAQGTVNLSGTGSKLALTGALTVGSEGAGILNLSGGGTVESVSGIIGAAAGGSGKAFVSGAGTTWTSTDGVLVVGDRGDGVLTLADSATVIANDRVDIARESGSTGILNIGAAVGEAATTAGTLEAGAVVFGAGDGRIVFNQTDSAYAFAPDISGAGGVEVYSGTTILTGTNTYTGGTRIEGGTLRAGAPLGFADNTAYTVNGGMLDLNGHHLTMSTLSGTGGTIGLGAGTLTISQDTDTTFAGSFTGSGTLTLDRTGGLELTGATSAFSGDVRIVSGTLAINNAFSSRSGFIGTVAGEDGRVDVTGSAALWTLDGDLNVGRTGSGALVISDGGGVEASGKIAVGSASLSLPKGSITVTGKGSRLSTGTGRSLVIGSIAGSTLVVENGGAVTSGTATLGQSAWTRGAATVSGTGSLWTTGSMKVGSAGATGVLRIADGGTVRATDAFTIGSQGTLNIGAAAGDTATAAGNLETLLIDFGTGSGKIVFNHTDTDYRFSPDLKGTGGIEAHSGTTTLFGNNIYTGETTVEGGILRAGSLLAFAQGGAYTVNGGVLDLNDNDLMMSRLSGTGGTVDLGTARLSVSQNADTAFAGSFTGSGTLAIYGPARLRLTGATSAYNGEVRVGSGTLEINNAFASGSGFIGTVAGEDGRVEVTGPTALWTLNGDLNVGRTGSGSLVISGGGGVNASGKIAVGSTSLSLPTGEVLVTGSGSRLSTGAGGLLAIGSIAGSTLAVEDGGSVTSGTATLGQSAWTSGTATVTGAGSLWTTGSMKVGRVGASGVLTVADGGTVRAKDAFSIGTQGRLNIGAAAGETAVSAGVVDTSLIDFGSRSGKIVFNHTNPDYVFAPAITGAGSVEVYSGTTILTGKSSYTGDTDVFGGKLVINGVTGAVNVSSAAMLAGSGTVGDTVVSGVIAPGNSIGTMNIAGDLGLGAGAVYQVEVNDAGTEAGVNSDLLKVAGAATIDKRADLVVLADRSGDTGSGYDPINVYTVVTAEGGVTGGFGNVTDNFAFLDSYLGYDATSVYLTLQRNDVDFVDEARTSNQKATAAGLDNLSPDTALYRTILGLYENEAPQIFDALSGEIHASANTVLRDEPRQVERAILSRIDAAFATNGAEGAAQNDEALAVDQVSIWFDALGGLGRYQGDGNAHTVDTSGGGALFGGDARVGQDWLFGLAAGYMNTSIDEKGFTASADTDSYYFGGYGSTQTGPFSFSFGGSYGHHAISTKRTVSFVGLSEQLNADYDARTLQAFAETGWRFGDEAGYLQPFAAASYVNLKTDGFSETGGMAALHAASQTQDLWTTTLGLRASRDIMLDETAARLSGHAGWQHAYGDLNGTSVMAFDGGSDFGISGIPTARDAALLGVGLSFDLSNEASLSLGYDGQLAEGVQDHNFSMRFDLRF